MQFKTSNGKLIEVSALTIHEVIKLLRKLHPELANLIEKYVPKNEMLFFRASYPFGAKIIDTKEVFLPLNDGSSISFNDPILPAQLREHLSYTPGINNPVGIILTKESEFYQQSEERIESYQTIVAGQIIGFAHVIDSVMRNNSENNKKFYISDCNVNAGARLLFMLANISNSQRHKNLLEAYGIDIDKPTNYIEQCQIFKEISSSAASSWRQEVLFISTQFIERLKTNSTYEGIYKQFLQIHRSAYTVWHYVIRTWESEINRVLSITGSNNYSAYAVSIAKHLFLIAAGGAPGFAPVTDDRMCPNILIEEAYTINGYGLTGQWPILMQPTQFNSKSKHPVYYSPNLSTLFNFNPETFSGKTTIDLLDQVLTIVRLSQNYILENFKDKDSYLYDSLKHAKFSFYHSDPDPKKFSREIKSNQLLPEEDSRFYKKGRDFPYLSPFVRGCIKIEPV